MSESRYTGLLLCGGQSSRMKTDKAFLAVPSTSTTRCDNDEPLFLHLLRTALLPLESTLQRIIISARDEAQRLRIQETLKSTQLPNNKTISQIQIMLDEAEFSNKGPASGILSAHKLYPHNSLLVLAVDFLQVESQALRELIDGHENSIPSAPVTCFLHPEDENPEPVMSIWTSEALDRLHINALTKGKSGPCFTAKQIWRDLLLLNSGESIPDTKGPGMSEGKGLVRPSEPNWIKDADTPEEWEAVFGKPPRPACVI